MSRPPSLALSLWVRLMKTHGLILNRVRRTLDGRCTLPQFDVMAQLHRSPQGLTSREISRRLLVTAGNVTGIVDRLAGDGLVTRTIQAHDRRSSRVRLTPRGRALAARLIERHRLDVERILAGVPARRQAALRALLADAARRIETHFEGRAEPKRPAETRPAERRRGGRHARAEDVSL